MHALKILTNFIFNGWNMVNIGTERMALDKKGRYHATVFRRIF